LTQLGLIGTYSSCITLTWFTPLLGHRSLISNNFEAILEKFGASFGDSIKEHTTTSKLRAFCKGSRLAFVYIYEFKQLSCDISWDKVALMNQFQFGLSGECEGPSVDHARSHDLELGNRTSYAL
jgi:hypothetical protein